MTRRPTPITAAASRADLIQMAADREDFLSSRGIRRPHLVTDVIMSSWRRSQELCIDTDRLTPTYLPELDLETPLARTAAPILGQLLNELANEPVGVILTDSNGVVLQRLCTDSGLTRALDGARLAPGFSYAEEHMGTNGIGTALERRAPILVNGVEHYIHDLSTFACAGVPIIHPISGALLGVLDLTSTSQHANQLLLVVARSIVQRIQDQLLSQANASERALFTDYLQAARSGGKSILAVGEDLVMMNSHTHQHFDADDRAALAGLSSDAYGATRPTTFLADLPSGITARVEYRPVFAGEALAGGVFSIRRKTAVQSPVSASSLVQLPGVVGHSAIWQQACRAVLDNHRRREWLVLEGEAGTGKLALLRGVHQLRNPSGHIRVLDAADASDPEAWLDTLADELDQAGGTVILRQTNLLGPQMVHEISSMLLETAARFSAGDTPWVAMTLSASERNAQVDAELLPHFPHSIEVPPLRHHLDDLRVLVQHLLGRVTKERAVMLSPAAMSQLLRLPWRGNVEQLLRILERVAQQRRTGTVTIDDLPAECRATSRRQVTQLGALERDAIGASLAIHQGSKAQAAAHLGISRATIYRKIREYGITWVPEQSAPDQAEPAGARPD